MFFFIVFENMRNMKREKRYDMMRHKISSRSLVIELGKKLNLSSEQIQNILNTTQHTTEYLSFSLGPPHYPGGFYGCVSINDFNIIKSTKRIHEGKLFK